MSIEEVYEDSTGGASSTTFCVGGEEVPGLTSFRFSGDRQVEYISDFWPEPELVPG